MYIPKYTDVAVEQIKSLPKGDKNAIKKVIEEELTENPHSAMELAEPLKGFRSWHFGDYRIVYRIHEDINAISISGVGKKVPNSESDIYRKLEALANQGKLADTVITTLRSFSAPR